MLCGGYKIVTFTIFFLNKYLCMYRVNDDELRFESY